MPRARKAAPVQTAPTPDETQPVEMVRLMDGKPASEPQEPPVAEKPARRGRPRKQPEPTVAEMMAPEEPEPDWMIKGRERSEARARERMQAS